MSLAVLAASLAGCQAGYVPAEPALAARLAPLDYPQDAELGEDLDVIVRQRGNTLFLTNRTARPRVNQQLWLNQQWVGQPPTIPVGGTVTMELSRFVNDYGETFPLETFLTPEKGQAVVLAELFDPRSEQRHRLTVSLPAG